MELYDFTTANQTITCNTYFLTNPKCQMMTPEEADRVQGCIQEIAAILYRNTPPEDLVSLESIEKTVRTQMLEHVSPNIALFLSSKSPEPSKANGGK